MTTENRRFLDHVMAETGLSEDLVLDNIVTAFIARKAADTKATGKESELFEFRKRQDGTLIQGKELYTELVPLYVATELTPPSPAAVDALVEDAISRMPRMWHALDRWPEVQAEIRAEIADFVRTHIELERNMDEALKQLIRKSLAMTRT